VSHKIFADHHLEVVFAAAAAVAVDVHMDSLGKTNRYFDDFVTPEDAEMRKLLDKSVEDSNTHF